MIPTALQFQQTVTWIAIWIGVAFGLGAVYVGLRWAHRFFAGVTHVRPSASSVQTDEKNSLSRIGRAMQREGQDHASTIHTLSSGLRTKP